MRDPLGLQEWGGQGKEAGWEAFEHRRAAVEMPFGVAEVGCRGEEILALTKAWR